MLTLRESRKFWAYPITIAVALTLAWLVLGRSSTVDAAATGCRALTTAEMSEAFGDAPLPWCKKQFLCYNGIVSGQSCAYCSSSQTMYLCCNQDPGAPSCTQTGSSTCAGGDYYQGAIFGNTAFCGSCGSQQYTKNGTCAGVQNADCANTCQ